MRYYCEKRENEMPKNRKSNFYKLDEIKEHAYLNGALDQTISEVYGEKEGLKLVKEYANEKGVNL